MIRTTGEHPFFAYNKGWVKASIVIGDRLLCADGQWVAVEDVFDTGEWEVVYNLHIADYHTYFVTDWDWGFSVWSHNTCWANILESVSTASATLRSTMATSFAEGEHHSNSRPSHRSKNHHVGCTGALHRSGTGDFA